MGHLRSLEVDGPTKLGYADYLSWNWAGTTAKFWISLRASESRVLILGHCIWTWKKRCTPGAECITVPVGHPGHPGLVGKGENLA